MSQQADRPRIRRQGASQDVQVHVHLLKNFSLDGIPRVKSLHVAPVTEPSSLPLSSLLVISPSAFFWPVYRLTAVAGTDREARGRKQLSAGHFQVPYAREERACQEGDADVFCSGDVFFAHCSMPFKCFMLIPPSLDPTLPHLSCIFSLLSSLSHAASCRLLCSYPITELIIGSQAEIASKRNQNLMSLMKVMRWKLGCNEQVSQMLAPLLLLNCVSVARSCVQR